MRSNVNSIGTYPHEGRQYWRFLYYDFSGRRRTKHIPRRCDATPESRASYIKAFISATGAL